LSITELTGIFVLIDEVVLMAAQEFDLSGLPGSLSSDPVSVGSGEKVRVRFHEASPKATVYLGITANGVTTLVPVTEKDAWVSDALFENDQVSVTAAGGRVSGIIETGA
jgi:hypothetical protein